MFPLEMSIQHSLKKKVTTMPVRQMTQEEKEELFGNGVVFFGMKPLDNSKPNSENPPPKEEEEN